MRAWQVSSALHASALGISYVIRLGGTDCVRRQTNNLWAMCLGRECPFLPHCFLCPWRAWMKTLWLPMEIWRWSRRRGLHRYLHLRQAHFLVGEQIRGSGRFRGWKGYVSGLLRGGRYWTCMLGWSQKILKITMYRACNGWPCKQRPVVGETTSSPKGTWGISTTLTTNRLNKTSQPSLLSNIWGDKSPQFFLHSKDKGLGRGLKKHMMLTSSLSHQSKLCALIWGTVKM